MILTGNFYAEAASNPKWTLSTDTGVRTYEEYIEFSQPFTTVPQIIATLAELEASNSANTRIRINVKDATTNGFVIEFYTWDDSIVYSVAINWLACE